MCVVESLRVQQHLFQYSAAKIKKIIIEKIIIMLYLHTFSAARSCTGSGRTVIGDFQRDHAPLSISIDGLYKSEPAQVEAGHIGTRQTSLHNLDNPLI